MQNTRPKQENQLLLMGANSSFMAKLDPPLKLEEDREYSIVLLYMEIYHSFQKIEAGKNSEFRYSPDNGANWFETLLETGSYEIIDINYAITQRMKANGHYDTVKEVKHTNILPNTNALKVIMTLKTGYIVDFTPNDSLQSVLGF